MASIALENVLRQIASLSYLDMIELACLVQGDADKIADAAHSFTREEQEQTTKSARDALRRKGIL